MSLESFAAQVGADIKTVRYYSGQRNVSSLLTNGWTGTVYLIREGRSVKLIVEGITAPTTGSTVPFVFPAGFQPVGVDYAARGLLFTTAVNPVVRRFDVRSSTNSLTVRNATAAEVLYGEVRFATTETLPTTLPGTPA